MAVSDLNPGEQIKDVRFSQDTMSVDLFDGRTITVPLTWSPRLLHATDRERAHWQVCGGGLGIHWPDLDEDLSAAACGPRALSLVGELAGGHPYLSQLAGSLIWQAQYKNWNEVRLSSLLVATGLSRGDELGVQVVWPYAGLLAGIAVGLTRILVWPFLSWLVLRQRVRISTN